MLVELIHGECLAEMDKLIDRGVVVDAIITDPPYGSMKGLNYKELEACRGDECFGWDETINQEAMLDKCNKLLRTNGALILFSQQPYTTKLINDAHGNLPFSYCMTWLKDDYGHALLARKAPLNYTEDICVFFKKYDTLSQHPLRDYAKKVMYFIGLSKKEIHTEFGHQGADHFFRVNSTQFGLCTEKTYNELTLKYGLDTLDWFMTFEELSVINRDFSKVFNLPEGKKYKSNVLEYKKDYTGLHPTQKPVALIEDLIKTYTNEGGVVLDFTAGSFTTGVACQNTGRNFIGIEKDDKYFEIARERLENHRKGQGVKVQRGNNSGSTAGERGSGGVLRLGLKNRTLW